MFDPLAVRRVDTNFPDENGKWWQCTCVDADDYDELLKLYNLTAKLLRITESYAENPPKAK